MASNGGTNPMDSLAAIAPSVYTASTSQQIQIFRHQIPSILDSLGSSTMTDDFVALMVDIIFQTLSIYDDPKSRKAVDDFIIGALSETSFMISFAQSLVQTMERHSKYGFVRRGYRLLKWSCLVLTSSQLAVLSKTALCNVAQAQAPLFNVVMKGPFNVRRSCRRSFKSLVTKSPDIYETYLEELKNGRIPCKDNPRFIHLMLDYLEPCPVLFDKWKDTFLEIYVNTVLNAREKPTEDLSKAFCPLITRLSHEDFENTVLSSSIKMLKRNPELILESVGVLLESAKFDLSDYANDVSSLVLAQARHADEARRFAALVIVRCLSQKSSKPDAVEAMFTAIKSVMQGSEDKLTIPYQRVGMINALRDVSDALEGNSLSPTVCEFLLSCYKDDGNEGVKLAALSCLAAWAVKSSDAITPALVNFFVCGLEEKETLIRRGHLCCLRFLLNDADAVAKMLSLSQSLHRLFETGFTKPTQRLDGVYAFLCLMKIAAVDDKADNTVLKEKIWQLTEKNEPTKATIIPNSLICKSSVEDLMACVDFVDILLVDYPQGRLENFSTKGLLQFILVSMCHPNRDIRKAAHDTTKKILVASPPLFEAILHEYWNYVSVVGMRDTESVTNSQVPFIPSIEVLVKALLVIAYATPATPATPNAFVQLLICSHHPHIIGVGKKNAVWRRVGKCLKKLALVVDEDHVTTIAAALCEGLLNVNHSEQEAAINTLSTLISEEPKEIYCEFEKHFISLPDRIAHDTLSDTEIKLLRELGDPKGMLSTEQGEATSSYFTRRDLANKEVRKKDAAKLVNKPAKTYREVQINKERCIVNKVYLIRQNLSVMLKALGEMAIANPQFIFSQFHSLGKFFNPLLRSQIVGDAAFETLMNLSKCTTHPLCNWPREMAAALRVLGGLFPTFVAGVENGEPSCGPCEQLVKRLTIYLKKDTCEPRTLSKDSFCEFIFPVIERILLSPKKTSVLDDALKILGKHMGLISNLSKIKMLSVLYHALGVDPDCQKSIGLALNALCLGLGPDEIAHVLNGVYAQDSHVRTACLDAVKSIPAVSTKAIPQNVEIATRLWLARHDAEKSVVDVAETVWGFYCYDFGTDYSGLYKELSNVNYGVQDAAARGLATALHQNPDTIKESLSMLFSLYEGFVENIGSGWLGRRGISMALLLVTRVLRTTDLPFVMNFILSRALSDSNENIRNKMVEVGLVIIERLVKEDYDRCRGLFSEYCQEKLYRVHGQKVRDIVVNFMDVLIKHGQDIGMLNRMKMIISKGYDTSYLDLVVNTGPSISATSTTVAKKVRATTKKVRATTSTEPVIDKTETSSATNFIKHSDHQVIDKYYEMSDDMHLSTSVQYPNKVEARRQFKLARTHWKVSVKPYAYSKDGHVFYEQFCHWNDTYQTLLKNYNWKDKGREGWIKHIGLEILIKESFKIMRRLHSKNMVFGKWTQGLAVIGKKFKIFRFADSGTTRQQDVRAFLMLVCDLLEGNEIGFGEKRGKKNMRYYTNFGLPKDLSYSLAELENYKDGCNVKEYLDASCFWTSTTRGVFVDKIHKFFWKLEQPGKGWKNVGDWSKENDACLDWLDLEFQDESSTSHFPWKRDVINSLSRNGDRFYQILLKLGSNDEDPSYNTNSGVVVFLRNFLQHPTRGTSFSSYDSAEIEVDKAFNFCAHVYIAVRRFISLEFGNEPEPEALDITGVVQDLRTFIGFA